MTGDRAIHHVAIDTGFGREIKPPGRLKLKYRFDFRGYASSRPDEEDPEGEADELIAEFGLGLDFSEFVRIEFDGPVIFRVLDESWLSTSTSSARWKGDLSTFAREVVGDDFAEMHRVFFEVTGTAKHYQFVTGDACLDVLAARPPRFTLHPG